MKSTKFEGIYRMGRSILTENLTKGQTVYGEKTFKEGKTEYRFWEPRRSKIGAALMNDMKFMPVRRDSVVLYLGASTGTTVSHLSDIAKDGRIYAVDIAPRVVRELVFLAEKRKNIFPLLFNAALPELYANIVEKVDFVFQDIAAPNQPDIFIRNVKMFMKENGHGMLAIKSRSMNVAEKPKAVFNQVENYLRKYFKVIDRVRLEPYEKDHKVFVVVKK
jgi:fibrillarin-like pre-rRNA processing protein